MPKTITSPVPEFPGTLTLSAPLTLAQCYAIETALGDPNEIAGSEQKRIWLTASDMQSLPALIACVENWNIQGQPEQPTLETFIATPRRASHDLIAWAFRELTQIYFGEFAVPNA